MKGIKGVAVLVLMAVCASANAQQLIELPTLSPGRNYVVVQADETGKVVSASIVTPIKATVDGSAPSPPSPPVSDTGLATFVKDGVAKVVSDNREQIASHFSLMFEALADQVKEGKLDSRDVPDRMNSLLDVYLGAISEKDQWSEFRRSLTEELNRRQLSTANQVEVSLREVSLGFSQASGGQALDPRMVPVLLKLVLAVISKDVAAAAAAVIELIALFRG